MTLKLISLSVFMFTTTALFAQGKFSAFLSIGAGQTIAKENFVKAPYQEVTNKGNTGSYYLHAGLSYEISRWRLSTGIEFFRTGFSKEFRYINVPPERIMAHTENSAIPLLLSYRVRLLKNVSIVPATGAAMIFAGETLLSPKYLRKLLWGKK